MTQALRSKLIRLAHQKPELRDHLLPILKAASARVPLYGHTDVNSAYLVDDYPYGFRARTSIRYWLEQNPSKGFRFVSQTMDPKTQRWNKPKASTYARLAAAMYLDQQGHVTWYGVTEYTDAAQVIEFLKDFPKADTTLLRKWAAAKVKFYMGLIAKNEEGLSGWTINGDPQAANERDLERNRKELDLWMQAQKAAA